MNYRDELFARVDDLVAKGPGVVTVSRITHIDDVRVLREAQALLTPEEENELKSIRTELAQALHGCEAAPGPPKINEHRMFKWSGPRVSMASKEQRERREFDEMRRASGGPPKLPAPAALLDAAEVWVTSHLIADRHRGDLSLLRAPWETATITPQSG